MLKPPRILEPQFRDELEFSCYRLLSPTPRHYLGSGFSVALLDELAEPKPWEARRIQGLAEGVNMYESLTETSSAECRRCPFFKAHD